MCLAIPTQVIQILNDEQAVVQLGGIEKTINLAFVADIDVGDYVIVHVGYALAKLDSVEAEKTLAVMREMSIL